MRKSFTWFLSLMVLLTAFATHGYAQAQETVELYAEDASYCYDEANDYTVTIAVGDFIQLDSMYLALTFNDEIFAFEGFSSPHASLSGITATAADEVITIDWDGTPVTIGSDAQEDILVLHFSVLGYPNNLAPSFSSDMNWGITEFYYTTDLDEKDLVNTVIAADGSLTVDVGLTGITTEIASEDCFGGDATVTVTAPEADMYLFNEDPNPDNWVWTSSASYQAAAGETVTIRVKDESGCISLKETVNIPETVDPVGFTVSTQDPACYGENGSVVINATGGTAPYTYYISPDSADMVNAVTKTNFQFSQAPGVYWVNVQDANDCANLDWVMIEIVDGNTELIAGATHTDVSCNGGTDGSITASATGGTGTGYMYSIDGTTWQDTVNFLNLAAGTYTVWVKDDNGCMDDSTGVVVDEPDPITFDMAIVDVTCGGEDDGEIAVTNIAGGTDPYTLEIEESGNVTSFTLAAGETSYTFTGLLPTYYSLTITDAEGCEVEYVNPNNTQNIIAVQAPGEIEFEVEITDPLCADGPAAVAIVGVTGGTGSYKYSFDNGSTWVDTMTVDSWDYPYATLNIAVTNAADSSCTVNYPSAIDADDVDNPAALSAWVEEDFAPTCIDGNDGNIHLRIEGGTAPYFYSINGSSWKETDDNLTIIKVGVGTHEIMVKDANDCEFATVIEVPVTMDENVIEAVSDSNIDCYDEKTGTISVNFTSWADGLTGGEPNRGVQFYVENEAGQVSSFGPSNITSTPTTFNAGTYWVWVVDQYTCESNVVEVEITENPELLIDVVYTTAASCFETYEGTITVHATGGNVPSGDMLQYAVVNNEASLGNIGESLWLDFETYNNVDYDPALSTVSFNVDGGTYWIAVRDVDCDEVWYGPIEVEGYEELLVDEDDIVIADPLCYGESDGSINVPMGAVSGGAGSYLFTLLEWVEGEWVELEDYTDQATGEFTGLPEGTYAVLVEDSEDCPSYTTEDIVLEDPAELTFATTIMHMSCEDANDGTITVNVAGGTPGYSYAINNTNVWISFGASTTTSKTYIATEPGTFVVWVKDANGCIAESDTVTILEPAALDAEITVTDASCYGTDDGSILVEGFGGWEGMTLLEFKVNDGSWNSATTVGSLPAGDHILHIRDVNGYSAPYQALDCEYSVPFTIGSPDPITYDVDIEQVSCKDGADGSFTVNILSGGTPFVDTDGDNDGFLVRLTGSGYDSGFKYTGDDLAYTFTGLDHSHYTLYIRDANGCELPAPAQPSPTEGPYTTRESWEVQEPETYLTLDPVWVSDATCYGSEDGQFVLNADGGTAPYKYWAGLSVEPDGHILVPNAPAEDSDEWQESNEFNVGAGTWVTWVLDANGCIVGGEYENGIPVNKWRVKVEQPDSIEWAFHMVGEGDVVHYVPPTCYGAWDGAIHLQNISGGAGVYNARVWGLSAAGDVVDTTYTEIEAEGKFSLYWLSGVPASNEDGFEVTVTDTMGCTSAVDTIYVDQPEELTVSLEIVDGTTCFGAVDGVIEAVAEGGTGDYEYQLLKNDAIHTPWQNLGSSFLVEVGNTFIIQVRDDNGCEAEDTIYLETPLEVDFTVEDLSCSGDEYANVRITATGTPERTFKVYYKEYEEVDTFAVYNGEFSESIDILDVFLFDNENLQDRHYAVYVEDSEGCVSAIDTFTFDAIQSEVAADFTLTESTECSETFTVTVSGGVGPYIVMVDDSVMTEMTFTLPRGLYTIKAMDSHMCTVEHAVEVVGDYVTRDTIVEAYIGYETQFIDDEAALDTMIAVGTYEFLYMFGECERTLNVEVIEVPRPLSIAQVQGEEDESPWVGDIVEVTGTVTGISAGEGFFVQDANAAWSGIWVAYNDLGDLAIGDGVTVVGEVAEITSVTTINASEIAAVDAPLTVEALVVDSPSAAKNEMYESVLVKVEGARATAANDIGRWTIYYEGSDNVVVNNWLHSYPPEEGNFYHVSGIVNARLDNFRLEPRMDEDIVDLTATNVGPAATVEFKVYPNPFNSYITIDNNDKLTRVVINNIAGQRVMDIKYPSREIRTANLVSGVYVVSLFTEDGLAKTERIVKR